MRFRSKCKLNRRYKSFTTNHHIQDRIVEICQASDAKVGVTTDRTWPRTRSAPIMIEPRRFRQIGSKSLSFGDVWHAGEQQRPDVSRRDRKPGWRKPATGIP